MALWVIIDVTKAVLLVFRLPPPPLCYDFFDCSAFAKRSISIVLWLLKIRVKSDTPVSFKRGLVRHLDDS